MSRLLFRTIHLLAGAVIASAAEATVLLAQSAAGQGTLRLDAEQAWRALAILRAPRPVAETLWAAHAATAGYRRLKEREASMGRAVSDTAFRTFLTSDTMRTRADRLERTLRAWEGGDFTRAGALARAYLPAATALRATVYLTIKPRPNSFVFDLEGDPAIFFFLDPERSAAEFLNTAAHELHHVGNAAACRDRSLGAEHAAARRWLSAFGEGWAMLAAAGAPDVHPHRASPPNERAQWDSALAQASQDLRRLERFFSGLLDGTTSTDSADAAGFRLFAERPQGVWYTVGWLMTSTLERRDGRPALVALLCDPAALIRRYQDVTRGTTAPRWSESFVARLPR